ncbi:hypothetical protein [Sphingomonas sp. OK281]|uniref:hypothetical protein n=1 Tax=Sphingomonas sp. OK281 TaxID=1881067 RepID=UPI0020C92C6B|nr:hypothetical protein [Sphingomonas sp. OK281]
MIVEFGVGRVPIVARDTRQVVGIFSRQDLLKLAARGVTRNQDELVRPSRLNSKLPVCSVACTACYRRSRGSFADQQQRRVIVADRFD